MSKIRSRESELNKGHYKMEHENKMCVKKELEVGEIYEKINVFLKSMNEFRKGNG